MLHRLIARFSAYLAEQKARRSIIWAPVSTSMRQRALVLARGNDRTALEMEAVLNSGLQPEARISSSSSFGGATSLPVLVQQLIEQPGVAAARGLVLGLSAAHGCDPELAHGLQRWLVAASDLRFSALCGKVVVDWPMDALWFLDAVLSRHMRSHAASTKTARLLAGRGAIPFADVECVWRVLSAANAASTILSRIKAGTRSTETQGTRST